MIIRLVPTCQHNYNSHKGELEIAAPRQIPFHLCTIYIEKTGESSKIQQLKRTFQIGHYRVPARCYVIQGGDRI